eukprot:GHVS01036825.1.p1 GENE.GHVS01036825.1~~GHVS01036825.1.p1  ORF type:complete len:395 (+),score=31.76 GHVS01036825.1:247-1431(+)
MNLPWSVWCFSILISGVLCLKRQGRTLRPSSTDRRSKHVHRIAGLSRGKAFVQTAVGDDDDQEQTALLDDQSLWTSASMSSQYTGHNSGADHYGPQRALLGLTSYDADSDGCSMTNKDQSPWWRVTFAARRQVTNVMLHSRTDGWLDQLEDFQVLVGDSTDCSSNSVCYSYESALVGQYSHDCSSPLDGTYLCVQSIDTSNNLCICDVSATGYLQVPPDYTVGSWAAWGGCSVTCGDSGQRTRTRSCTGSDCDQATVSGQEDCDTMPPCADSTDDCQVSDWTMGSCGMNDEETDTRQVTHPQQGNGQACPTLSRTTSCISPFDYTSDNTTSSSSTSSTTSSTSTGGHYWIIAVVVVGLLLIIVVVLWLYRRHKKKKQQQESADDPYDYMEQVAY